MEKIKNIDFCNRYKDGKYFNTNIFKDFDFYLADYSETGTIKRLINALENIEIDERAMSVSSRIENDSVAMFIQDLIKYLKNTY